MMKLNIEKTEVILSARRHSQLLPETKINGSNIKSIKDVKYQVPLWIPEYAPICYINRIIDNAYNLNT